MEILHFASDGSLIKKIAAGYSMQHSDSVVYLFAYVDGIAPSDYVATLVCTPNGASQSITLAVPAASQTIDGQSVVGFGLYLPASVLQIAGPLALSLFITSDLGSVLVTYPTTLYVTAAASDEWDTPISQSQWQEMVNYVLGCNKGFIGDISDLMVLDSYKSDGSYWFIYFGNVYDLKVVTVDGGVWQYKTEINFPDWQKRYFSSSWGGWSVYYHPFTNSGGTFIGPVSFNAIPMVLLNGNYSSVILGDTFQNAFLAKVTAANVNAVLGIVPVAVSTSAKNSYGLEIDMEMQFTSGSGSTDVVGIQSPCSYYGTLRFSRTGGTSDMHIYVADKELAGAFVAGTDPLYLEISVSWCPHSALYSVTVKVPGTTGAYAISADSDSPTSILKVVYGGASFSGNAGYALEGSLLKLKNG